MQKKEFDKYFTLLSLYLAQSIPMSFFSTVVPVIMRMESYSLESIGYIQLIKLPWIAKFLWAPIVDKSCKSPKHYKRWILLSELIYAMVIISIGFFNLQADFSTIIALMVIAFTASATQDIATDAFAILSLRKKERSLGNSMQSAGSFLGTLVGSGVLLIIYSSFGWTYLLFGLAGFVLVALIPLTLYKSKPNKEIKPNPKKVTLYEFVLFFKEASTIRHLLVLILFYSGLIGILTMVKPYLVDLGYSIKEIGFISGIYGTACGALMAIPAGIIIRKIGLGKSVYLFAFYNLIAASFFLFLTFTNHPLYLIYVAVCLLWSAYAMSSVFIYTLSMAIVRSGREGTDFTIQIVITHLSSLFIAVFSGKLAHKFEYRGLFIVELLLCILVIVLLPVIFKKEKYVEGDPALDNNQ
ncbi:MFS transporter [Sunxiuqinia sp. A32]|uniref:MFS transporter n=1 Tax=Sunxiuqinia sp. A32 TaxID=3461496 RepID=UPI004045B0EB